MLMIQLDLPMSQLDGEVRHVFDYVATILSCWLVAST